MTDEQRSTVHERLDGMEKYAARAEEQGALLRTGGLWRQAPSWVPRTYTSPVPPPVLRTVETCLRRLL
ncbi:hypothetical protein [Streptomyces longispororuber]|uniref:hypothetical protein n=1 Tax=Streptomyces longispororuber TaxID=68230 RepID=UPI0036F7F4EC